MIYKQNHFQKGIDQKFNKDFLQGAERLHKLQNARLFKRGETGYVSRIEGYETLLTSTNISGSLDVIEYKDSLFALSRTSSGNFAITVLDQGGVVQQTITYTATDTDIGELSSFEDYIYIAPHNKFLYNDEGTWTIHDFISTVPTITSIEPKVLGETAEGRINIDSGYITQDGREASGTFTILMNTLPDTKVVSFKIVINKVNGNRYETNDIVVDGTFKRQDIASAIVDAINGKNAFGQIGDAWEASISENEDEYTRWRVKVTARNSGFEWNSYRIFNTGHAGNVIEEEDRPERIDDIYAPRLPDPYARPLSRVDSTENQPITDRVGTPTIMPILAITTAVTSGGVDAASNDPVAISFTFFGGQGRGQSYKVMTNLIDSTATASDVATAVKSAFDGSVRFNRLYNTSLDGNDVVITAKEAGDNQNTNIGIQFTRSTRGTIGRTSENVDRSLIDISVNPISGGTIILGSLEPDTDYWYKVRFVYDDGHRTLTSFPEVANTGNLRSVELTIDDSGESDIFTNRPTIEIFRKTEGGDFFLIDSVRVDELLTFEDDGKSDIRPLNEEPYVWTKAHQTQEFVNNRYVQANVEYFDLSLPDDHFIVSDAESDEDNVLPKSSLINVYTRPLYENGTYGFHKNVGKLDVGESNKKLSINQEQLYDDNIKEFGFYLDSSVGNVNRQLQFNSAEIANRNIPTLDSVTDPDREDFYPDRTKILYGYKYIMRIVRENNIYDADVSTWSDSEMTVVYDDVLRRTDQRPNRRFFVYDWQKRSFSNFAERSPEKIENIRIFNTQQTYIRALSHEREYTYSVSDIFVTDKFTVSIYKLANADAVKEAAFSNQLFLSVNEDTSSFNSSQSQVDLDSLNVRVIGMNDKSDHYSEYSFIDDYPFVLPALNSKMYLQLEESPLDEVDDTTLNISEQIEDKGFPQMIVDRYVAKDMPVHKLLSITDYEYTMSFDLFNIQNVEGTLELPIAEADGDDRTEREYDYKIYNWREQKLELFSGEFQNLPILYLGSKLNEVSQVELDYTPFRLRERNNLLFTTLKENTVADQKIIEEDIHRPKTLYENQVIWSEPIIQESFSSGTRNFLVTSSFNLPTNHGKILKVEELHGRLYAFCEKGVAVLFVGEVVAEQQGGEMFVDTSRFITDYRWMIESLKMVRPKSIVKFETSLFFSDGYDVYMIDPEGIRNVSNGAVGLQGNDCVGNIDPFNYEYRLSDPDNNQTWAYSIQTGEWFGPYTYADDNGTFFRNQMFSIIGNDFVKHNTGNTFGGSAYTTVVESVANDLDDPVAIKLFRKFYIGSNKDVGKFSYSKDGEVWQDNDLSATRKVNGQHRIGINNNVRNQSAVFWKIESEEEDFTLNNVGFQFRPRRRA